MRRSRFTNLLVILLAILTPIAAADQSHPLRINAKLHTPFRFVAYGDTRFTDPSNTKAANPEVRQQLVRAIADAHPNFVTFGGDIAYNGDNPGDWQVYDLETAIWRKLRIPVYPALGNHDLHGDASVALGNYFARFPKLKGNRFYSVDAANSLMLTMDSSLDLLEGPQGDWLRRQLDHLSSRTDFVFIVLHHPPYTSSSDEKEFGGGHSARLSEQHLAAYLEERQSKMRPRIVVFAGHVHNYERHEHGGVTYFVTGGGGAHAYPITRAAADLFQSREINYHYILLDVQDRRLKATMNRLEMKDGIVSWTQPDSVIIPSSLSRE